MTTSASHGTVLVAVMRATMRPRFDTSSKTRQRSLSKGPPARS